MAKRRSRTPARNESPFKGRVTRLRALMREVGVSHLLVTDPNDVAYLTGFLGGDSFLLVPPSGKPTIISDGRYDVELDPQRPMCKIFLRTGSIYKAVADVAGAEHDARNLYRLGVQGEHVTLQGRDAIKKAFKKARLPESKLYATEGLVGDLRERKDASEIALIRAAAKIQEEALEATLPQIQIGMTEFEVCAVLEYEMKVRGSTAPGFTTIVAAQANGALPHYRPGTTRVKRGEPLLIDWGAIVDGYHSDMCRTFNFGRWSAQMREIYEIVREAQRLAINALGPGVPTREVDRAARDHITKHGYGKEYNHGLGHGLGLQVHEEPRLSHMTADDVLEPGHVVTIEPGIYLPGIGGVRIEDDYAVTERGRQRLTTLPTDIEWCTL